ncbi:hypothetical protein [Flagellimonas sp. 2504JD1-5]
MKYLKLKPVILIALGFLAISFTFISCSGEDGTNGVNGNDGVGIESTVDNGDGTFTINYSDGSSFTTGDLTGDPGNDGAPGDDGNANVQRIIIDVSQTPLDQSTLLLDVPELTNDMLQNHVLLFYLELFDPDTPFYLPIPGGFSVEDRSYTVAYSPERVQLRIANFDKTDTTAGWTGTWDFLHIVLVEISGLQQGKGDQQNVLKSIKAAGVDTNDYYAVMAYFGLEE